MTREANAHENRHWSREELVARYYGLDAAPGLDERHIDECEVCLGEWKTLSERRAESLRWGEVSVERLRAQRQAVFAKIERRRRPVALWGLAPAAATALLLVVGIATRAPHPVVPVQTAAISASDRALLMEVSEMLSSEGPRAAAPLKELFDVAENYEREAQ